VIIAVDVLWALRVCSVVPADGCVLVLVQRPEHGDVSQACINWELHLV